MREVLSLCIGSTVIVLNHRVVEVPIGSVSERNIVDDVDGVAVFPADEIADAQSELPG